MIFFNKTFVIAWRDLFTINSKDTQDLVMCNDHTLDTKIVAVADMWS